jgi:fibronectin-binding autotransporter adhesin
MRIRLRDNPSAATDYLSLTKADAGLWILNPVTSNTYGGTTTISAGALRVASSAASVQGLSASSPLVINGGVLETSGTFTRTLGAPVAGTGTTVQIPGGASGFAAATTDRLVVTLGGGALTWGSTNFAPTSLILGSSTSLGETEITNDIALGTANRTVTVNSNGNTGTMVTAGILSGVISGGAGGNLIKNGGGVLMLGNANTYTGSTRVDSGTLVVTSIGTGASSSLGASGALILRNPGNGDLNPLIYVGAGETASRALTLTQSGNFTGNRITRIDSSGSGPLIWDSGTFVHDTRGDSVARVLTLDLRGSNVDNNQMNLVLTNSTNATFANTLAVTKSDGGTWILNPPSANTFTGGLSVGGGNLGLTANGIGAATAITVTNSAIFAYGGPLTTSAIIQGNNSTSVISGQNSITIGGMTKTAGNNQWTISNNLENGALLTVNGNFVNNEAGGTAATQTISIRGYGSTIWNGVIGENAAAGGKTAWSIALHPDAFFRFDGGSANTYTGITSLSQGTMILNKTLGVAQIGTGTSQFNFGGGVLRSDAGNLTGANSLGNTVFLTGDPATVTGTNSIELTGLLTNNGGNRLLVNSLSGGANLTLTGNVSLSNDNTGRILVMLGSGTTNVNGVVQNGGTGAGSLTYSGNGTLNLSGANTATGNLTLNRGTTVLSGANGSWAGNVGS